VAIDRATRWVFVRIYPAQTAANARRFLRDLQRAAPMKITRVLTDNGKAFTDRLFDLLCTDLGIEHRLAPPMRPQTNGMVERFNGRIEEVLQSHRFHSGEDLEQTILRYVHLGVVAQIRFGDEFALSHVSSGDGFDLGPSEGREGVHDCDADVSFGV
ncbi:DDE-type integrase/transposase/recombinase, partial [Rhodovulum sulfidophilum]|uniref:DDE-type integrase/transposase/recombinase n=1 Tax=Rhodovulum sulfidophilum TaxID=35806 RepID=UPI001EE4AF39